MERLNKGIPNMKKSLKGNQTYENYRMSCVDLGKANEAKIN